MARWKLLGPHYLNTAAREEWEYSEADRKTGRPKRIKLPVPRLIDPHEPGDWTTAWGQGDNRDGETIVCIPGKGEDTDIEFLGDPTPDMIPVDDEARAISASFADHWRYKPEGTNVSHSQSLVDGMQAEMAELQAKPQTVHVEGLDTLVGAMAEMMKANQALIASLAVRR
jgi:hypothetical protein